MSSIVIVMPLAATEFAIIEAETGEQMSAHKEAIRHVNVAIFLDGSILNHIVIKKAGIERGAIALIATSIRLFARNFREVILAKAKTKLETPK